MRLQLDPAATLLCICLFAHQAATSSLPYQTALNDDTNQLGVTKPRAFPFLTWLRNEAIELVFGPPPSKSKLPSYSVPTSYFNQYSEEVVLRFNISNREEHIAFADSASRLFLDTWAVTKDYVDVRLHRDRIATLRGLLPESVRDSYGVLVPDVASAVFNTFPAATSHELRSSTSGLEASLPRLSQAEGENVFFRDYRPISVIVPWMKLIEAMFPAIASTIAIGTSYEGRDILGLRVGIARPDESTDEKKTLVIMGGMHGREWISTTTVNYVAWSFVSNYGREPIITKFLEHFQIVFIPVINPDGMEYTWQVDRLWRKSRQQTSMRFCRGLDLDHAFGFQWDDIGSNSDPCSESYGGAEPWESVEALALADWARNETQNGNAQFVGLIDLHSYSQQVLFPYAYSCDEQPPNLENLTELGVGLAKAIRLSSGETYTVTSACEEAVTLAQSTRSQTRIESNGGSAIDWFYHELRAHFSYQIKLRDTGSYGFLLPKEHIVPTGEEVFHAMKYLGDYLLGNNGIERSLESELGSELRKFKQRR